MAEYSLQERLSDPSVLALPHLTWRDVFTLNDGHTLTDEECAALDAYFGQFARLPQNDDGEDVCIGCQRPFYRDGLLGAFLAGATGRASWKWSITHGECHCAECGWPARAYHFNIGAANGGEPVIKRLNLTLPVHPSELSGGVSPAPGGEDSTP